MNLPKRITNSDQGLMSGLKRVSIAFYCLMFLLIFLVGTSTPLSWSIPLILWTLILLYSVNQFRERVFLLGFLFAFFMFLLGRVTLLVSFNYGTSTLSAEIIADLSLLLSTTLMTVFIGYVLSERVRAKKKRFREPKRFNSMYSKKVRIESIRRAAVLIFWVCTPFAFYQKAISIRAVLSGGYTSLYSESFRSSSGSGFQSVVNQLVLIWTVSFVVFLATIPHREESKKVVLMWIIPITLGLATGSRASFVSALLLLICYAIARNRITPEDKWLGTKGFASLVVISPFVVLILGIIEKIRGTGTNGSGSGFLTTIVDFIYTQGVSANAIINGIVYSDAIPKQNYLLEFLHYGLFARILNIPILRGNSIEQAMNGGSFSHSLSYVILGRESYLSGRGTGSSFIIEAFFTFGFLGVVIVGLFYGFLISFIDGLAADQLFLNIFRLLIVQDVFWALRGSTTGFLSMLGAPSTWLALSAIWVLSQLFLNRLGTQLKNSSDRVPAID